MNELWYPNDEDYYAETQKAIHMAWVYLLEIYRDGKYVPGPHDENIYTLRQSRRFLSYLFQIRSSMRSARWPTERQRHEGNPGQLLLDWDRDLPITRLLNHVFSDFYDRDRFELKTIPLLESDIEEIRQKFEAWEKVFDAEEEKRYEAELQTRREVSSNNGWRLMPHLPDPRSMELQRDDSIERRKQNDVEGPLAEARAARDSNFFKGLSSACFIEGYTDYLVNRPLPEVVSRLRRGCDHASQALEFGFTAHAWNINDYLHEAIAVNHHKLAETVVRLRQSEWDTNRIRPVNWLITRIRIVMDLFLNKETDLQVLLENERKGLFDEPLPSELTPDIPEMRNFYELLKALVARDGEAFNQALASRMPIREAHFISGGTIAPIALLDVHGLALCRLARKRGLKPQASHVYLPLELLDL